MNKTNIMNKYFLFTIILISLGCFPAIDKTELESNLESIISNHEIAGFGVSVFDKNDIHYIKGFGYEDYRSQKPYTIKTKQISASVAKTLIGIALMKCQELDLLDISDPINAHLPFEIRNPHYPDEEITIIQLATHTSGLKYSEQFSDEYNYAYSDSSLAFIVRDFLHPSGLHYSEKNFHYAKPGELWDYSNAGAVIAALIVEEASGMKYDSFIQKYISDPLSIELKRHRKSDKRSVHYEIGSTNSFIEIDRKEMGIYPVGDLLVSLSDLTKLFQMIMNGGSFENNRILKSESVEILTGFHQGKNIDIIDSSHKNMGVFWWHDKNVFGMPVDLIGHNGGDIGVATLAWFSPETNLGYIMLCNTGLHDENFGGMVHAWQSLYKYGISLE